jgi:hypothetical protein
VIPIVKEPPFLAVIFQLRTAVTRHLAVLLPTRADWSGLTDIAAQHQGLRLSGTQQRLGISATFAADPVRVLLDTRIPPGGSKSLVVD